MESKLISVKILRPISIFHATPSKSTYFRKNPYLTKISAKSTANKSLRHASTFAQWRTYKVQTQSQIINYSTITPYCDQNFLNTSLKAEIVDMLTPLIAVNTDDLKKFLIRAANKAHEKVTRSHVNVPQSTLTSLQFYEIADSIKNLEPFHSTSLKYFHSVYRKKIGLQALLDNYSNVPAIGREVFRKKFYCVAHEALRQIIEHLLDIQNVLVPHFVLMNDTPKKDAGDTGGVKDTSDAAPTQNAGDRPKSDPQKDLDKTTKSDSGHESGGASSPSSSKTPSSGKSSAGSASSPEEFPNFPEEAIWEPLPDDVELGFEEEMSDSRRETDHRWYPHLKPPTPQTQAKYYPKLYYEETTTYEPPAAPSPPPQPPPHSRFRIYEDPEPEPEASRHWSQISFDMPPSPIPVAGPSRWDPGNRFDTPPALRGRTDSAGRTVQVRRRIEYSPSDTDGSPGPRASTPQFRPPLSSTVTSSRRNVFPESPDDSPIVGHGPMATSSPCPRGRATSSPTTPPRCPPRGRFSFSPEPVASSGRRRGDPFVFSPEPVAPTGRNRSDSFVFSPEPVVPTGRQRGDPFVFSDDEDGCPEDPRTVTHIRESVTTCDDCNTCVEEIRNTTIRKRLFANDGSLPVGLPVVKTQVTKSVPAEDDGDGDPCGSPMRDDLHAPSTSRMHGGRCSPSCPCSSGQKKKTPIIDSKSQSQNFCSTIKDAKTHREEVSPKSLSPSLITDNFILYQFKTTPDKSEAIIDEISRDEAIIVLINFFPNCHIRLKEKLLGCIFANYKTTYPLRICFLDLQ